MQKALEVYSCLGRIWTDVHIGLGAGKRNRQGNV